MKLHRILLGFTALAFLLLSAGFVQAEVTVETAVTFSAEDLLVTELSGYDLISLPVGGSVEGIRSGR